MRRITALLTVFVLIITMFAACKKAETPPTATELLELGEKYLLELDYEQALVQFLKVIEIEPMNPRGYTGAADTYIGMGQPTNSVNIIHTGIKAINDLTQSQPLLVMLDDIGDSMFAASIFDVSALAYEALLAENPQSEYAYKLAQVYLALGMPEKAVELLKNMMELLGDDNLYRKAERLENQLADGNATGLIQIVDVSPKNATAGQETTYSVTVRYASANADGCIIYAGANTGESTRYRLYDEYILPNTYGVYTFQFSCVAAEWSDAPFGIYVNISENPHPESWTPFDSAVYALTEPVTTSAESQTAESPKNADADSSEQLEGAYSIDDLTAWGYPPATKLQDIKGQLSLDDSDIARAISGARDSSLYMGTRTTNDSNILLAATPEGYLRRLIVVGESQTLPEGPRGIKIGMTYEEVVGKFYIENNDAGTFDYIKANASAHPVLYKISDDNQAYVFPDLFGGMMILHYTAPDCPHPALMCVFSTDGILLEFHVEIPAA